MVTKIFETEKFLKHVLRRLLLKFVVFEQKIFSVCVCVCV